MVKIGKDIPSIIVATFILSFISGLLIGDILDLDIIKQQNNLSSLNQPQLVATTTTTTKAVGGVRVISLSDKRCKECDTTGLLQQLKSLFPGIAVTNLDYGSNEGKKLYNDLKLTYLPALLFDDSIKSAENYPRIREYLDPVGSNYYSLRIGANFNPSAEICDNGIDDDNDGLIDCNDQGCNKTLLCRKEIPKRLDLFVMSQCPYGVMAMNSMKEVLENFKDDIDFRIHYIAMETDGGFRSLHGQPEVDENIRELCAMKYYPDNYKYMDYIWCRNKNIQSSSWESCAKESGMDAGKIKRCFEGTEGKKLLSEDIKLANELDIGASPTWIANNKNKFSGIDAETIKINYCKSNPNLAGCGKTLSSSSNSPTGGCGG